MWRISKKNFYQKNLLVFCSEFFTVVITRALKSYEIVTLYGAVKIIINTLKRLIDQWEETVLRIYQSKNAS